MQTAVLGGGRMGEALVGGLLDSGADPDEIVIAEVDPERRRALETRFPGVRIVPSAAWAVAESAVVVVAVKPAHVAEALDAAAPSLAPDALIVSIAAGVGLDELEAAAPGRPHVRAMPNAAALVGRGAAAIAPGSTATEAHLAVAEELLGAVGRVVRVSEAELDAVTGLSGSGPAYVFLVAEAMIEAGVLAGLARDVSSELVIHTLLGAATLLAETGESPEALRAVVTSPAGTTAAGLRVLEERGVRAAFLDAVQAAAHRSAELGGRS